MAGNGTKKGPSASSTAEPGWANLPASVWSDLTSLSSSNELDGVPPVILAAINVAEYGGSSGESANNPTNSVGVGGYFAAPIGNGSVTSEAEEAASVFAAGLKANNNSVMGAEDYYQEGPNGAKTSPGQTIFSYLSGVPATVNPSTGSTSGAIPSASGQSKTKISGGGSKGATGSGNASNPDQGQADPGLDVLGGVESYMSGLLPKVGAFLLGGALLLVGIFVLVSGNKGVQSTAKVAAVAA